MSVRKSFSILRKCSLSTVFSIFEYSLVSLVPRNDRACKLGRHPGSIMSFA